MNNKQIACVVLSMIIGLMAFGTMKMKNKASAANDAKEAAASKADSADKGRKKAQLDLDKKTRESQGLRDYLDEWQPYLMQTKTDTDAERMFVQKLKQDQLVIFKQGFDPVKMLKGSTIPSALRARVTFEDDYHKLLTWMGSLESSLPTSRVSSCRITKGQKGNEVKMELNAEVPLASVTSK
ncbi:MAG: hypothetical protein ACI9UA_000737 [Pseudoalteromonas tetraodonis]|jgi:hypothetical protein